MASEEVPAVGDVFLAKVTDLIVVFDADATIVDVNDWGLEHFGYRRDEVVGRSMLDFTHPDEASTAFEVMFRATDPNEARSLEAALYRIRHADGEYRELWLNGAYAPPTGDRGARWVLSARSAPDMEVFDRLIDELSAGTPPDDLLPLVPLLGDLREPGQEHAVFHLDADGQPTVTGSEVLARLGHPADPDAPAARFADRDVKGELHDLPSRLAVRTEQLGLDALVTRRTVDPLHDQPAIAAVGLRPGGVRADTYVLRQMVRALAFVLMSRPQAVRLARAGSTD